MYMYICIYIYMYICIYIYILLYLDIFKAIMCFYLLVMYKTSYNNLEAVCLCMLNKMAF